MTTRSSYAGFSIRLAALGLDFFVAIFAAVALDEYVLQSVGVDPAYSQLTVPIVLFLYFAGSWASSLRATPFQFLFGMRVVDETGSGLGRGRAALRAVGFGILFAGTMLLFKSPQGEIYTSLAVLSYMLAALAIVTSRRQAAHDYLAQTFVVRRAALDAGQALGKEVVSTGRAVLDILVLGFVAYMVWSGAAISRDRAIIHRTNYAISETAALRTAIAVFYERESRWPADEFELGAATRGTYPDGGYYEMEEDGAVRIQFEVLPELKNGSLIMAPFVGEEGFSWDCQVDGRIEKKYVPQMCRKASR